MLVRISLLLFCVALTGPATAQEQPYFVTYSHHMEEPGSLEIAPAATVGVPREGQRAFLAPYSEFEYGVVGRWTTEIYLEGQTTAGSGAAFTGWRWENRVRPLVREHLVNPVLYLEYEDTSEADKITKEVIGHSADLSSPNRALARDHNHELEGKLIVSTNAHDWNFSENFIVEKNFSANEGFEFGYALGAATPLGRLARPERCTLCRENFSAGGELYGGLGSTQQFGLSDTAHYFAPVISWQVSDTSTLHFSASFGLTHESAPVLFRFGYSHEISAFGRKLAATFRGKR